MGKCPPGSNPIPARLKLPLGGRPVSQGVPLETDSPTAIHPIGTALTPIGDFFKVYSFRSAVFCATVSPLVGYGSSPFTDGLECREVICRIYHRWGIAETPLRVTYVALGRHGGPGNGPARPTPLDPYVIVT